MTPSRMRPMSLLDTLSDPQLFQDVFRPAASWSAWRTVLKALFALPPTADDLVRYSTHTGRSTWPSMPAREAWLVVGRRGGKSRMAALVAVSWRPSRTTPGSWLRGSGGM